MKEAHVTLMMWIAAIVGATVTFVMSTVFMSVAADASIIMLVSLGGALVTVAFCGMPDRRDFEQGGAAVTAAGGVAAFWAAPAIALSQRASDAPPGTEVMFFTTSAWALIVVVIHSLARRRSLWATPVASMALAVLGGATVVANWERPSSFSPFVRFPEEHALMLVAGLVFAFGVVAIRRGAADGLGRKRASALATVSAALVAVAVFLPSASAELPVLAQAWRACVVLILGAGAFALAWNHLFIERTDLAPTTLAFVPVAFLSLTALERLTVMRGPDPVVWSGALAGAALVVLGMSTPLSRRREESESPKSPGLRSLTLATAVALVSIATLFLPAMDAGVVGVMGGEYRASWTMLGAETAAGWLVALAGLMLAAAMSSITMRAYRRGVVVATTALIALGLYPSVAATPLRTATRWIPADVQQTYGTEYARLTFVPVHDPVRLGILGACAILAMAIIFAAVRHIRRVGSEGAS